MLGASDESGANAVEFALVLPILIILLFGIISGGMLFNQLLSMNQATREGARLGATMPEDVVGENGEDWEAIVTNRAVAASSGVLSNSHVTVTLDDGVVTVEAERPGRLDIVMAPAWTPTLRASSIARYEIEDPP